MLQRRFIIALAGLSIVLNACGGPSSVAPSPSIPLRNQSEALTRQVGASLYWKPAFLRIANGHTKMIRLLYSPASLEIGITKACDPSVVTITQTGTGHVRKHEYSEFAVAALSNTSYTCSVYATAPHAQIRATLKITVEKQR